MLTTQEVNELVDAMSEIMIHAGERFATTAFTLAKLEQKPEMNDCKLCVQEFNATLNRLSTKYYVILIQLVCQSLQAQLQSNAVGPGNAFPNPMPPEKLSIDF